MAASSSPAFGNVPPDDVRRELDALVQSPVLANSQQLCRFLRYLVERTLSGDTGSLKESLLGTEVFDRGYLYDPRTDPVVRVEARRLRAKLEEYYASRGANSPVIVELPKGSYVPVFHRRARQQVVSIGRQAPPQEQRTAVAVLPFSSVGADPETDYFSDGLTDEVIHLLANIPGLNVVARSSVYQYKGRTLDAREIGRLLNASHLVEGSVRRYGERLRIAAQLVECGNGYQGWSHTFERNWQQIFDIQTEIATSIASTLRLHIGDGAAPRSIHYTQNLDAYNALLKGRFYVAKRTVAGFKAAMDAYRQAIALDARYAPAWAGLADCYSLLGFQNVSSPLEARLQGRQACEKALALDPRLPVAHLALGQHLAVCEWDWPGAIAALERAIQLDPGNAEAHYALSKVLATIGRVEEALPVLARAERLDPLSLIIKVSLGWELALLRRYREADITFQTAEEFDPHFMWTYVLRAWSQQQRGLLPEAIASMQRALNLVDSPVVRAELAHALGKSGRKQEALEMLNGLLDRSRTEFVSAFDLSRAWEGLGEREKALEQMELACEQRAPWLLFAGVDPAFDTFRGHPRFEAILRRMNLAGAARRLSNPTA